MKIIEKLLDFHEFSRSGKKINTIKKIVIHWVGNANSTAIANRNYFNRHLRYASSHYIIGLDGEIIQCIPEDEIAWHGHNANSYSIGIENCHPDWEGKFKDKTYQSLIELCADICKRYNLNPLKDIIRHYDCDGADKKDCPHYYVKNPSEFEKLKQDVKKELEKNEYKIEMININLFGKNVTIQSFKKDNKTYVKLRGLQTSKILEVGYNGEPTINDEKLKNEEMIKINGSNYIYIRDIQKYGFDVQYDSKTKKISVKSKKDID